MQTYEENRRHTVTAWIAFLSIFFFIITTNSLAFAAQPQVDTGDEHTVGLKTDGTVLAVGWNGDGQLNVGGWSDIVQVDAGAYDTVGLKADGRVVAVGYNEDGQLNVGSWTGISQVAAGDHHTVGLRSDGTVVAVGSNEDGALNVGSWTNIVQVAAGAFHTVGLRSDGRVVAVGYNGDGQLNVGSWTGISQVAAGWYHTVGLRSDGTVVAVGGNEHGQLYVGSWTGISQVSAGAFHTVGLRLDGTVVAVGDNEYGALNVGSWTNIVQVAAGWDYTVGLRSDGTVVAVGYNGDGQCNTAGWNLGPTSPPATLTGIQITGASSNITTEVQAGNNVQFTVNAIVMDGAPVEYRFFTRAGYGEPDWGGNKWTIVQPYSPNNTVMHTFDVPGTYFLVGHIIYPGETWTFGDPQSGIVVEVSDPSGTGIQITGTSSNIVTTLQAGDVVQFAANAIAEPGVGAVHYRFFTRAGYGEQDWGGNKWTLVQDFGAMNTVAIFFNEPGIYFLACHAERAGEPWAFGDPQTGIPVEVWPVQ